jgi:type VI protein secretion system component Hcp
VCAPERGFKDKKVGDEYGEMILVHIDQVPGDCGIEGYQAGGKYYIDPGWFVAQSFSFGVVREMKESGEKGGTEDINIGVGELEDCQISKSMDRASPLLAQFAINGHSLGTAFIDFVEVAGKGEARGQGRPFCYLRYKLDRCFIKSWTTSGDADDRPTEEVAFYYNKIAFEYLYTLDGKVFNTAGTMKWDNVKNEPWDKFDINLERY